MSFLSPGFAAFLAVAILLRAIVPRKLRPALLLAASLFFYGSFGLVFLGLLVAQIAVVYGAGRLFERAEHGRKRLWAAGLTLVLGPLIVFKYLPFLAESVSSVIKALGSGSAIPIPRLILPLGISFYTLRSLSYLIDVYRGKMRPVRDPVALGLAVSFFPQILAGPIDRPIDFLARLRAAAPVMPADVLEGGRRIVWGLFQKLVIADQLARFVGPVFDRPQNQAGLGILAGIFFYTIQIYCDFSGYSDLAIGISTWLGFRSPENFRKPYFSQSVSEFWSRWHISLSSWLRDYLFMPVSSALSRRIKSDRVGPWRSDQVIYAGGVAATMLTCGLWHGAGWTFVLWGAGHATVMIFSRLTHKRRNRLLRRLGIKKNNAILGGVRRLMTFVLVSLAWVLFRSPTLGRAGDVLGRISFAPPTHGLGQIRFYLILTALFFLLEALMKPRKPTDASAPIQSIPAVLQLAICALLLCLTIILGASGSPEFLYLKF